MEIAASPCWESDDSNKLLVFKDALMHVSWAGGWVFPTCGRGQLWEALGQGRTNRAPDAGGAGMWQAGPGLGWGAGKGFSPLSPGTKIPRARDSRFPLAFKKPRGTESGGCRGRGIGPSCLASPPRRS